MKKVWGIQSIVIGLTFVFGLTVFADQQSKQDLHSTQKSLEQLMNAMKETGARAERIQLHYGNVHETYDHVEEAKDFAVRLGMEIGLTEKAGTANQQATEFRFERLENDVHTELRVMVIPSHTQPGQWDSYVMVKLNAEPKDLSALQNQLSRVYKVLEGMEIIPQFNSCVQGIVSDKLENDVQLEQMNKLLDLLGAEVVEKVEDPTVKSFSAYSSQLPYHIFTNGKKMNVQAGIHVDRLHQITRITIGTPIITIEY